MIVRSSGSQPVRLEQDVVLARQTVRKLTQECAMRLIDQTKLVTAVSEPGHELAIFAPNSSAWYTGCQPHTGSSSAPGGAFVEVPICGSC